MFDADSRYAALPTATHVTKDGRDIVYSTRRFLPRASAMEMLARVVVTEGDRLDRIAARTLGDPIQYGQIADANEAMNPEDLVAEPGRVLFVANPT